MGYLAPAKGQAASVVTGGNLAGVIISGGLGALVGEGAHQLGHAIKNERERKRAPPTPHGAGAPMGKPTGGNKG